MSKDQDACLEIEHKYTINIDIDALIRYKELLVFKFLVFSVSNAHVRISYGKLAERVYQELLCNVFLVFCDNFGRLGLL